MSYINCKKVFSYENSLQNIVNFSNDISNKISNSKSIFDNIVNRNYSSDYGQLSPSKNHENSSKCSHSQLPRPFSLYCSDKSSTSKCTSQGEVFPSDDDDYGFYDENDQQGIYLSANEDSDYGTSPFSSPLKKKETPEKIISMEVHDMKNAISHSNNSTPTKSKSNYKQNIICILENAKSSLACRSFKVGGKVLMATISMRGCRILQTELGITAQYKFMLAFESNEYIVWKQFSDFRLLANSIIEYHQLKKSKEPSYHNTIDAWNEVIKSRPWFYQDLSIRYLSMESSLLDTFMTNLFNEVENINVFLEFVF